MLVYCLRLHSRVQYKINRTSRIRFQLMFLYLEQLFSTTATLYSCFLSLDFINNNFITFQGNYIQLTLTGNPKLRYVKAYFK